MTMPSGQISALQAMQMHYGITASDLKVTASSETASGAIENSGADQRLSALVAELEAAGYHVGTASAYRVEVPINRNRPDEGQPVVDLVSYELHKDTRNVGSAYHIVGPQRGLVFARARRWDGSVEIFADHQGKIERALLDNEGLVVSATTNVQASVVPAATDCRSVCNVICDSGLLTTLGECIARCLAGGPENEPLCAPLCTLLISLGCVLGCDKICSLLGQP